MIIKLIAHRGDLQPTWLVVLGLLGTLNPSPNRYYATSNEFCKLTDYVWVSVNTRKLKTEHANCECNYWYGNYAFIIEAYISEVTEISDLACIILELKKYVSRVHKFIE